MEVLRISAGRLAGGIRAAGPVTIAITLLGLVGGILLIAVEFSTIAEIDIGTAPCDSAVVTSQDQCQVTGLEQHGGAMILLGLLALAMTYGAGRGRSKPAAAALVAVGAVVLAFALARDLPKTNETGLISRNYDQAKAKAGSGFRAELAAGAVLLLAGGIRLLVPSRAQQ